MTEKLDKMKQDLLDAYLMGELQGQQLEHFREMVASDPEMAGELKFQEEVLHAIRDEKKLALRDTLNEFSPSPARVIRISRYSRAIQLAAAAVILALVIGGGFLYRALFDSQNSSHQLFEEYFETEYDLMTVRSITSTNSILNEGMDHFARQEYLEAIHTFAMTPDDMLGKLYTGFSYMHLQQYDEAEVAFREILDDGKNMFVDQAAWHLGLCYLATDQQETAEGILNEIANSSGFYKTKALELLTRMGSD